MNFKTAHAEYTGGNIWLFHGELTDGNYFLMDDEGAVMILDEDPADFEESLYDEWQEEHCITFLSGAERLRFCDDVMYYCAIAKSGGFTNTDRRAYSRYLHSGDALTRSINEDILKTLDKNPFLLETRTTYSPLTGAKQQEVVSGDTFLCKLEDLPLLMHGLNILYMAYKINR